MARKPAELRPLMTRVPERLRRKLEREANRNDRSMNSEIVSRLERSLDPHPEDEAFAAVLGGKHNTDLIRALTAAILFIERGTGKQWNEDLATAHQVHHALHT